MVANVNRSAINPAIHILSGHLTMLERAVAKASFSVCLSVPLPVTLVNHAYMVQDIEILLYHTIE